MKRVLLFAVIAALGALGAVWFYRVDDTTSGDESVGKESTSPKTIATEAAAKRSSRRMQSSRIEAATEDDDEMSPQDRALIERIESALERENFSEAVACAKLAQASTNESVRQSMVETLGWFGKRALPELTPFIADPSEDIRESAFNEWTMALSEIEAENEKLPIAASVMAILTDEDQLEEISGEFIGVDEKLAVESLLSIIESGGSKPGIAKAKETYEFVTGEEFESRAAAEKWIAEEYVAE